MMDEGYYYYYYCYYYSVTYTFPFINYLLNMIAIAFWKRIRFLIHSLLYYCLKIGWFAYHLISLLLPIVFADHSLLKKYRKRGIGFMQPIWCILCHFLIQAFGF